MSHNSKLSIYKTPNSPFPMTFRLSAKSFFNTYPHCDVPKDIILAQYQDLGTLTYCIIAKELHQDGTPHIHVCCTFDRKRNFVSPTCFDILYNGSTFHGNYSTARNKSASINYCKKEDQNPLEYCPDQPTEEEEIEDIFEYAKNHTVEEFTIFCIKHKVSFAYMQHILATIKTNNTIHEESAGTAFINEVTSKIELKDTSTIQKLAPFMTVTKKRLKTSNSNRLSWWDQQDVAKQPGQSILCPSQSSSLLTSIHSNSSMNDSTSQSSSMTCPSPIFLEKARSIWLTQNSQDQFTADTQLPTCPQDWLKHLQPIDIPSHQWIPP